MDAVNSLGTVCIYLKDCARDEETTNLRRRLNRAHVENCRLRKKAQQLEHEVVAERLAKKILQEVCTHLIRQMDSLRLLAGTARA